jgi:transcriptional antiterminator
VCNLSDNSNIQNDLVKVEDIISLKHFPPMLRKIGKYLLKSDHPMTIAHACDELNLNKGTIYTEIYRARKKGNDFQEFIDYHAKSTLHANKLAVYDRLCERAVSDASTSHNDRKTYLQLTGDLKESTNINVGTLAIGVNISGLVLGDNDREKGTIDITPTIPKGKD